MSAQSLPPLDLNQRYDIDESKAYLRISRAKLYQKLKAGEIRAIKDGSRIFIPGAEIIRCSTTASAA